MWETIIDVIGVILGVGITALVTLKIERDRTKNDISKLMDSKNDRVFERVESLNRELQMNLLKENLKFQKEWEQKKIDADLISKSRIKWIDDTKKLTSEYITDTTKLFTEIYSAIFMEKNYYQQSLENKGNKEILDVDPVIMSLKNDIGRRKELQNELMGKLVLKSTLIRLQFSDNDENNVVVDEVMNCISVAKKFINEVSSIDTFNRSDEENVIIFSKYEKVILQLNQENYQRLENLTNLLRKYFKNEWEKAKLGE